MHTGERICEIAEDKEARAVIVSAHRKSMLTEFLLGSTTNYLTHSCKRPVVVLHAPRGEVCSCPLHSLYCLCAPLDGKECSCIAGVNVTQFLQVFCLVTAAEYSM